MFSKIAAGVIFCLTASLTVAGQSATHDVQLLAAKGQPQPTPKRQQNFIGKAYRQVIWPQLGRECFFETTCGPFSRQALKEFGVVKGFFLSVDRLSRCNRFSINEAMPSSIHNGKVIDYPAMYRIRQR